MMNREAFSHLLAQTGQLIESPGAVAARLAPDIEITCATEDSRRVRPGCAFIAVKGAQADGYAYIAEAAERGARVVLGERPAVQMPDGLPYVQVHAAHAAVAILAQAAAGMPSESLCTIGITGTNGKSSTAYLTQSILREAGMPCALIGTIAYDIGGERRPAPHTTPFGEDLAQLMNDALQAGDTHMVMETSSHALAQGRVAGICFQAGAFTNLTQDHLDYHESMEQYLQAKLQLFRQVSGEGAFTVVNNADAHSEVFREVSSVPCISFGRGGDVTASEVRVSFTETHFLLRTPWGKAPVALRLLGKHNVWNALCAAALAGGMGVPIEQLAAGLEALKAAPGRFEPVQEGQDFAVVIDYAHTDDGLRNVLEAARELCKKRIITVFGCGGDRDKGKRPKMGAVAGDSSDYVVLTSDNPRTEDPHRILLDVEVGLQRGGRRKREDYEVIPDRVEAIHHAVSIAQPGDLILIAGKGHEDYQIIGRDKRHFDDFEVAHKALKARLSA